MGQHWQDKVWHGHGAWAGDPFLRMKENILTDEVEVWYEVPNQEPVLVFHIPTAQFDIDKLCQALHAADNRNKSVKQKIIEVDAANEKKQMELAKAHADREEEGSKRLQHALLREVDPGAPRVHLIERKP